MGRAHAILLASIPLAMACGHFEIRQDRDAGDDDDTIYPVYDASFDSGDLGDASDAWFDSGCGEIFGGDPENCGGCGHSCEGKTCAAGFCESTLLATQDWPTGLAIDSTSAYWTSTGNFGLNAVNLDGSNLRTISAQFVGSGQAVALNASTVYWTLEDGLVESCPLSGCTDPQIINQGAESYGIVLDATNVYWGDEVGGTISTCPLAGCGDAGATVLVQNQPGLETMTLAVGRLYWTTVSYTTYLGTVAGCELSNCAATIVTYGSGLQLPFGVTADSLAVYWAEAGQNGIENTGRIVRQALAGGPPQVLASLQTPTSVLAVDDVSLYWGNLDTIVKCGKTGCNGHPTTLAQVRLAPAQGIAVDNTSVYWTESNSPGAVVKAPK